MQRFLVYILVFLFTAILVPGQKSRVGKNVSTSERSGSSAVVVDERLAVLRSEPGLYAKAVKRLETGSRVSVFDEKDADGVKFYRVVDSSAIGGWIQSESFVGSFRKADDFRLVRLIQGSSGFVQIHRCAIFLDIFKESDLRPTVLLLYGDRIESSADDISVRASETLSRREMAAAKAPIHSFYLNYTELEPFWKLGIRFLFNEKTNKLHYNGDSWFEITTNHPESPASIEARERIKTLTALLETEKK